MFILLILVEVEINSFVNMLVEVAFDCCRVHDFDSGTNFSGTCVHTISSEIDGIIIAIPD